MSGDFRKKKGERNRSGDLPNLFEEADHFRTKAGVKVKENKRRGDHKLLR